MLKTMFMDNWFSTIGGLVAAAVQYHKHGMGWGVAIAAAIGIVMKDAVPTLSKILGKGEGQ